MAPRGNPARLCPIVTQPWLDTEIEGLQTFIKGKFNTTPSVSCMFIVSGVVQSLSPTAPLKGHGNCMNYN